MGIIGYMVSTVSTDPTDSWVTFKHWQFLRNLCHQWIHWMDRMASIETTEATHDAGWLRNTWVHGNNGINIILWFHASQEIQESKEYAMRYMGVIGRLHGFYSFHGSHGFLSHLEALANSTQTLEWVDALNGSNCFHGKHRRNSRCRVT